MNRRQATETATEAKMNGAKTWTKAAATAAIVKLLKSDSKIDTRDKNHVQNVNRNALKVATKHSDSKQ